MNSARLDLSFVGTSTECYPEGRMEDAVEAKIALTLPVIPELVPGLTDEQRVAVLASRAAMERAKFIEMNGDPFGPDLLCAGQVEWYPLPAVLKLSLPVHLSSVG